MEEQNQALGLLVEMLEVASKRGAFSRIETIAIQDAINKLQKPVEQKLEVVE